MDERDVKKRRAQKHTKEDTEGGFHNPLFPFLPSLVDRMLAMPKHSSRDKKTYAFNEGESMVPYFPTLQHGFEEKFDKFPHVFIETKKVCLSKIYNPPIIR